MINILEKYRGAILLVLSLIICMSYLNYNVKRINSLEEPNIVEKR